MYKWQGQLTKLAGIAVWPRSLEYGIIVYIIPHYVHNPYFRSWLVATWFTNKDGAHVSIFPQNKVWTVNFSDITVRDCR